MICFDLAIDQIAQSGLSSLKVIYYSAQLFSLKTSIKTITYLSDTGCLEIQGASLVDDEIMECDGRDYNKKTCFPIVKKDNKKGKNEIY